jgi:4-hydroxy-3-methylbut-2-enyl diphosphate reductase IspH
VGDFDEMLREKLAKYETVALLSGSSTPMSVVDGVDALLQDIK